jgi:tight adherence protein C
MFSLILLGVELALFLLYLFLGKRRYGASIAAAAYRSRFTWLLPAAFLLLDQSKLMERLPDFTALVHHKLLLLYGRKNDLAATKMFCAELIFVSYGTLFVFTMFSLLAGGDLSIASLGLLAAGITPALYLRELNAKIKQKQRLMILELPEVLNTIILLVNAGETVNQAWMRCVQAKQGSVISPLLAELSTAARELEMNSSFSKVMEEFSKRCALQEVSLFTSTLLINQKRGGNDFVLALQTLSLELWQRRKAVSRTLGEEASSKLVFPMVMIFMIVMAIVASPALLIMSQ